MRRMSLRSLALLPYVLLLRLTVGFVCGRRVTDTSGVSVAFLSLGRFGLVQLVRRQGSLPSRISPMSFFACLFFARLRFRRRSAR